jgi:hypothetical protein
MKPFRWLGLAVAVCHVTVAVAEDRNLTPQRSRLIPTAQVEPGAKPLVVQEGPTGLTPDRASVVVDETCPPGETVTSTPFMDSIAGFKNWLMERRDMPLLRSWAGAEGPLLGSDVEDPYWLRFDVLWGWFRSYHVPPMLTTGPQASLGMLGNEGTQVLFGGENIDLQTHVGGRAVFGFWMQPSQAWGFEASYFFLSNRTSGVQINSSGNPLLAEPFLDALNGTQNSIPIANEDIPGTRTAFQGFANVYASSRLQGLNVLALNNSVRGTSGRVDWAWGYRYLRLDEGIQNRIIQASPPAQGQAFGTHILAYDDFGTENSFHGFDVGMRTQWWWGCWSLDVNSRLALGASRGTATVFGQTIIVPPTGAITVQSGGIYALSSNIGHETKVRFSVVPEIEVGVGYQLFDHCRLTCMYNFLAWTTVVRPGSLVDTNINPNLFPPGAAGGPIAPERNVSTSTFWMNGLSLGLEIRY